MTTYFAIGLFLPGHHCEDIKNLLVYSLDLNLVPQLLLHVHVLKRHLVYVGYTYSPIRTQVNINLITHLLT